MFFKNLFSEFNHQVIYGLNDELKAIYLLEYQRKFKKNILFVTNTLYEANHYYQRLSNYTDSVLLFPMDDFLTSEALALSPELKISRLETIYSLLEHNDNYIVITNLMGYLRFLPSSSTFLSSKVNLRVNQDYDIKVLSRQLYNNGYVRDTIVNQTGTMAVRGFVLDIFPVCFASPIRIEFWGDTVTSIRTFDVDSQLTLDSLDECIIYPNTELLGITDNLLEDLKQRDLACFGEVFSLRTFGSNFEVFYDDYRQLDTSYQMLLDEMFEYSVSMGYDGKTVYMNDLYQLETLDDHYFLTFDDSISSKLSSAVYQSHSVMPFTGTALDIKKRLMEYMDSYRVVIVCLSDRYKVQKIFDEIECSEFIFTTMDHIFEHKINFVVFSIEDGFILNDVICISENEFFNRKSTHHYYKTNFKIGTKIRDVTKLEHGDYVVHVVNGIGRYCGIKTLMKDGLKKDYLNIEYRGGDHLYIPVEKIDMITKYSSSNGIIPKINKLGTTEWAKTKLKAKSRVENMASELLELYASRESSVGYAFEKDDETQLAFEKEFPFQETADQLKVVDEIKHDMESIHPMDRLLCGDVGYGKTEVAFRAIFKAILSGKQVAFLCPTTILSNQHYKNAIERFQSFPVRIALLNRFVSPVKVRETLNAIREGKVDLVIGTHRIFSEDVVFHDLGLLVVDEEQRFGVRHKEKIKKMKNNIDILTLSATPIPRTLQMSMTGIRSLSLIETPPVNRYPVQTYVIAENKQIIKDAIYKELSRQGQVFILYNHVDEMEAKLMEIHRLVPDARITFVHGKMDKKELESVMMKFIDREYDVLLCTTIIETGIDIPAVNTLLIYDADHFGLSQLYQIRGRVGRSNKIAYCYLMYHAGKSLSDVAVKRLQVIREFTELGSGFAIAMRDLSIRGAGDILGSEQAGFVDAVGVELFLNMLHDEIKKLKGETVLDDSSFTYTQPLLNVETAIDSSMVEEEDLKIEIHRKINEIDCYEKLYETKAELEDRFGPISENMLIYMYEEWFEKMAARLHIEKVNQTKNFISVTLPQNLTECVQGDLLFTELSRISRMFRFSMKKGELIITLDTVKLDRHFIYYLIEMMEILEKAID